MKHQFLYLLLFLLFISCSSSDNDNQLLKETTTSQGISLSPKSQAITVDDAIVVAQMFSSNENKAMTKAPSRAVSNTKTLETPEGEPLMHIINFTDDCGFVVVSATTNYTPILAYSERGNLVVEEDSPVSFYLNEIGKDVVYYKQQPLDSVLPFRQQWRNYEKKELITCPDTKSGDITSLVNSYMNQWYAAGYDYYPLSNAQAYIPSDVYSDFVSTAEREANPDFDYMDYSFVTIGYSYLPSSTYGPLIGSTWGYYYPYSNSYSEFMGCGTIALGQIMYYYNYPDGAWDWDNIYSSTGTTDTRALLYYIKNNINPFGGSNSATVFNAAFLSASGYSKDLITHNNTRVANSIINNHPVYMSGLDSDDLSSGHAWVCEGYQNSGNTNITYTLWVIDIDSYPSYDYVAIASSFSATNPPDFYYLNWGWFGDYNSWFVQDNFRPYSNGPSYSSLRLDIVDIYPDDQN
jgi:hypothetical protein